MAKFELDYDEGLALYDDAIEAAEEEVIHRGLPISSKPLGEDGEFAQFPQMPADLSQVQFGTLQKLIGQFTAWFGYAIGQLKVAEGQRNAAEKQRTFSWSSIRRLKSGTVSDKDDAVRTDRRYAAIDAKYEHCDAKVRIYNGIVEGLKRDIETISRAASVLEARTGVEGRGVAVGRKGLSNLAGRRFKSNERYQGRVDDPPPDPPPRAAALDVFKRRPKR